MARIGYGKIGRSWNLDRTKATSIGGDIDVINALVRLAERHPQHEFVLVGKNSGENPQEMGYPDNVSNPWSEWRNNWRSVPEPTRADEMIDHFRSISGNIHETLDHMIVWAGQHGSANSRIPMIGSDWITAPGTEALGGDHTAGQQLTNAFNDVVTGGVGENLATPQYAFVHYISWYLDFISRWREQGPGPLRREEIWLCPDPRNYLKCREKRWPIRYPVLAQYDFLKYHKSERFGRFPDELQQLDPTGFRENSLWVSNVAYCYSGLELTAVADPSSIPFDPTPGPHKFGMVVNENLTNVKDNRLELLKTWVLPNFPDAEIRGHWTEKSQLSLNRVFEPVPYREVMGVMKSFATTLTTPASGSGWATAKPWEAFALGSVCFFHPRYDDQQHILPADSGDADVEMLRSFLRVSSAQELARKVDEVTSQPELYFAVVTAQRRVYERGFERWNGGVEAISDRLNFDHKRTLLDVVLPSGDRPWLQYTTPAAAEVQTRLSARPRGTNEERKRKPPVSRRRALTQKRLDQLTEEGPIVKNGVEFEDETHDIDLGSGAGVSVRYPVGYDGPRITGADIISSLGEPVVREQPLERYDTSDHTLADCRAKFDNPFGRSFTGFNLNAGPIPVVHDRPVVTELNRPTKDAYFIGMARHVSTQSTCLRRSVGCVLVDDKKNVLATGFNGVPRGYPHCNEGHPCPGAGFASGQELGKCMSAHAEINALLQCSDVDEIESVYLTVSPCTECIKALMNTGARRIVFLEEYVQPESREMWLSRPGNEWVHFAE